MGVWVCAELRVAVFVYRNLVQGTIGLCYELMDIGSHFLGHPCLPSVFLVRRFRLGEAGRSCVGLHSAQSDVKTDLSTLIWHADFRPCCCIRYSGFFLHFRPADGTNSTSPRCDSSNLSLCSSLYHSQTLAPKSKGTVPDWSGCQNFSTCDGFCRSGHCNCGSVPCGSYLFDHRNGSMLRNWLVEEYVGGPLGVGADDGDLIAGMFFDGAPGAYIA
eukprot:SAG31_NODE_4852_length_2905_cov_3.033143_2_plen_216_part_00